MKTQFLTLVLLVFLFNVSQAQWGGNHSYNVYQTNTGSPMQLTLQSFDQSQIQVLVDGQVLSNTGTQVTINFGQSGNHQIKVSKLQYYNIYHVMGGYRLVEIYNGNIYIQPGEVSQAMINQYGQISYINTDYGYLNQQQPPVQNGQCRQPRKGYQTNRNNNNYYNGGYQPFMSDNSFAQLKSSIQSKSFDDTRKTMAIQALQSNNLSARQVAELLTVFSFESNRLDVAKQAYLYSKDRQNFFLVNNSFRFSSSIDELNQYIIAHS